MTYRERIVDAEITEVLSAMGAAVIEGARGCGKTATGEHHAASSIRLDALPQAALIAETSPQAILDGPTPRLIDEWRLAPLIWNAMRHEADRRQAPGQFILTGSATPADDVTRHAGVGRIGRIRMRPMTLAETGQSSAQVRLTELFAGSTQITGQAQLSVPELAEAAVRGGWPAQLDSTLAASTRFASHYVEELTRADIPQVAGVSHNRDKLRRTITSLARNLGTELKVATLTADINGSTGTIHPETVGNYLTALGEIFVLEPLTAWNPHIRSKTRLRSAAATHFVDPSLAVAALRLNVDRLLNDLEYFGFVFESLAIRDLRVFAEALDGTVYRYRDNTGLEVDTIVELRDGRWGAIEVKLGESQIDQAETNLLKLARERVDTARLGEPSFLAVVTGSQLAYTRPSGVHVVPLSTLAL